MVHWPVGGAVSAVARVVVVAQCSTALRYVPVIVQVESVIFVLVKSYVMQVLQEWMIQPNIDLPEQTPEISMLAAFTSVK